MRKKLRLLFFIAVSVFLAYSCSKYEKMLDVDLEDMEVDGNMNWGIPLIDAGYSIEKILNQFGDMGFINNDEYGDYSFEYIIPKEEYLNVADFNNVPNVTFPLELNFPLSSFEYTHLFENNDIDISTEDVKILGGTLKSGQIKFDFSQINIPEEVDYNIVISSNTVFNANGSTFKAEVSKNNSTLLISCDGLKIETPDSKMDFDIEITLNIIGNPPVDDLLFTPEFSLTNIKLEEAKIELLREYSYPISINTEFSVFPSNLSLDATIYNPAVMFDFTNTFDFDVNIRITKAYLQGPTHTESILIQDNTLITIPKNHVGPFDISNVISDAIRLTSTYDLLVFECEPFISEGVVSIKNSSTLAAGVTVSIPFDIKIDEASFNDTLAFNLPGLGNLSFLDLVNIRTAFASSIPSDFNIQILLYNSTTQTIIDHLFEEPLNIKGSYTGNIINTDPQYISITNERIGELQKADKLILQLSLNTDGQHRSFNKNNSFHAKVGARIQTSTQL